MNGYYPAPDELRDAWINDADVSMPEELCQHGNCPDDGCDKCEATAEWIDEISSWIEGISAVGRNAGGEDVRVPASSPVPLNPFTDVIDPDSFDYSRGVKIIKVGNIFRFVPERPFRLQLDYPVWRMTFSQYGEAMGLEVPA